MIMLQEEVWFIVKEKKISLYMGNFNLPCFKIGISKKDGSQGYEKYNENYAIILFESNIDIRGDLIAKKDERPSAIKNFYYNNRNRSYNKNRKR